eukprot:m.66403 g.66403  ORF g.66403 m.66403 type:complete len:128 (+) comp14048_c1_seq1:1253-1636(+)
MTAAAIRLSTMLQWFAQNQKQSREVVRLQYSPQVVAMMINFCESHDLPSNQRGRMVMSTKELSDADRAFASSIDGADVVELIKIADILGIQDLLDLACLRFTELVTERPDDYIRDMLNLPLHAQANG